MHVAAPLLVWQMSSKALSSLFRKQGGEEWRRQGEADGAEGELKSGGWREGLSLLQVEALLSWQSPGWNLSPVEDHSISLSLLLSWDFSGMCPWPSKFRYRLYAILSTVHDVIMQCTLPKLYIIMRGT